MDGRSGRAERRPRRLTLAEPQVIRTILGREFRAARELAVKRDRAERQQRPGGAHQDFLAWARGIPTSRGLPLDFDRFPFQPELYRVFGDPAVREAVLMKGTQVGASELLVRLALFFPDVHGATAIYVFAAARQLRDFADMRVDRLLEHSPYLRGRKREPWNRGLKTIGRGELVLRGSQTKNDLLAVAADILLTDEYDSLVRANIPEAEQRVRGSLLGLIRRVGVPSDPEYGIGKLYRESDQRCWQVDCGACGERQSLSFDENVDWEEDESGLIVNPRLVCRRCREPLDVRRGRWIAAFPERSRAGFHVNRLIVHGADLTPLIEESKRREPYLVQSFHNNGLGLPYSRDDIGLDRTAIAAAVSAGTSYNNGRPLQMLPGYNGPGFVTAGIDVASNRALNVRISLHLDPLDTPRHRKLALLVLCHGAAEAVV